MGQACRVCSHPSRRDIERAVIEGRSHRTVAAAEGLSPSSVYRHIQHLDDAARRDAESLRATLASRVVDGDRGLLKVRVHSGFRFDEHEVELRCPTGPEFAALFEALVDVVGQTHLGCYLLDRLRASGLDDIADAFAESVPEHVQTRHKLPTPSPVERRASRLASLLDAVIDAQSTKDLDAVIAAFHRGLRPREFEQELLATKEVVR